MAEGNAKAKKQSKQRTMYVTLYTKSFKALLPYAIPYALAYSLLPLGLEKINIPLGGLLLSGFVVILINVILISLFKMTQKRLLEKIECSRVGIITTCIMFVISSVVIVVGLGSALPSDITISTLYDKGAISLFLMTLLVMALVHYAVVLYSLWFLQKLWPSKL